jgi:hypothetical protein
MDATAELQNRLRKIAISTGRSKYDLAVGAGINHASFLRFINGHGHLTLQNVHRLARSLGYEIDLVEVSE